jgi:hypothetical protein
MKRAIGIILSFLASALFFSCATVDPLKDLPQSEYEQAQKYRMRIEKFNFAQYAPDEFAAGETAFKAGEGNYKKDNLTAKKSFDEANGNYRIVMRKGIDARMKMSEDEIAPVRTRADEIKASVAVAAEYKDAKDAHDRAIALANEDKWEDAEPVFVEARQKYEAAYQAAKTKKDKADTQFTDTKKELDALKALVGDDGDGTKDEPLPPDTTETEEEPVDK